MILYDEMDWFDFLLYSKAAAQKINSEMRDFMQNNIRCGRIDLSNYFIVQNV